MYNVGLEGGAIYHFLSRPLHKYYINIIIQNMAKQIITVGKKTYILSAWLSGGYPPDHRIKVAIAAKKKMGNMRLSQFSLLKRGGG